VSNLLPLGLRSATVIILGFDSCARFMRGSHVVQIIRATEFKGADVLCNPTLAHAINLAITQHANAARFLPHSKPSMRCEFPPDRCAHIFLNERHWRPPSQIGWARRSIAILNAPNVVTEEVKHLLEQALPLETQGFTGRDETGELALAIDVHGNQAHLHT
jgi:hypothetical protein